VGWAAASHTGRCGAEEEPVRIDLSDEERRRLESLVRRRTAEQRMVVRARIVLAAAQGEQNTSIAERLGIALHTVIKWRKRYFEEGMKGLADCKRLGSTPSLSPLWRR
jgi:DNA-directed RNA polymerase specialized sigma24 family protein